MCNELITSSRDGGRFKDWSFSEDAEDGQSEEEGQGRQTQEELTHLFLLSPLRTPDVDLRSQATSLQLQQRTHTLKNAGF